MADKTITFEGIEFSIPDDAKKLPVKAVEAWEEERIVSFVKALVGPDAWKRFTSTDPDMEKFGELADVIGESYGFESAGESSGSEGSSEKTSGPSKPTSSASMDSSSPVSASA